MGTETDSLLSAVEEPPSCSPYWADWKWQLRNSVDDVEKLSKFLQLNAQEREELAEVAVKYPFSITPYYLSLIDKDNPDDPVRRRDIKAPIIYGFPSGHRIPGDINVTLPLGVSVTIDADEPSLSIDEAGVI